MLEKLFQGVFDTASVNVVSVDKFLLCVGAALLIGACIAFTASRKAQQTHSFLTTLLTLPALTCVVIMLVNGNVGLGVATAGTFSLVRFRSAQGTAKEMALIFLSMVAGLACGMGYLGYAALFTVVLCLIFLVSGLFDPAVRGGQRVLRITVPEDLDYTGIFSPTLNSYCKDWHLNQVKTTNMGALFRLTYSLSLRDPAREKEFLDQLRLRNGNLEISLAQAAFTESEL